MTTIVLSRGHWFVFVLLCFVQVAGWWMILQRSPEGVAVFTFLRQLGWWRTIVTFASWIAGSAFLTTVICAKLLEAVTRRA